MTYGGFWVRVVAYLIDTVLLAIAQFAIFALFGVGMSDMVATDPESMGIFETTGGVIAYLITTIGSIAYFVVMESSSKQATLGKMAMGLVVTDLDGNRISLLRALGRYFAKILSGMILLIGYIMVAFTDRKQGLHDMICSTLVVRGKPGEVGVDTSVFE